MEEVRERGKSSASEMYEREIERSRQRCVCACVYVCKRVWLHWCVCGCEHVWLRACVCVSKCVCGCEHVCVCEQVYVIERHRKRNSLNVKQALLPPQKNDAI